MLESPKCTALTFPLGVFTKTVFFLPAGVTPLIFRGVFSFTCFPFHVAMGLWWVFFYFCQLPA